MTGIDQVEAQVTRKKLPEFRPGDTVRVEMEIVEGDKKRVQAFQGTVIQRRGAGPRETFTVRKISAGVGVERIFPACAPGLVGVEVVHRGDVRRAKLWYLRGRKGKSAQVKRRIPGKGSKVRIVEETPDLAPAAAGGGDENPTE
jgi:large subunit ribosomal protein L19